MKDDIGTEDVLARLETSGLDQLSSSHPPPHFCHHTCYSQEDEKKVSQICLPVQVCVCVTEWKWLFVCSQERTAERRIKWEMCYMGFMVTACASVLWLRRLPVPSWMAKRRRISDFTRLTCELTVCFSYQVVGPKTIRTHMLAHIRLWLSTHESTYTYKPLNCQGWCVSVQCCSAAFNP